MAIEEDKCDLDPTMRTEKLHHWTQIFLRTLVIIGTLTASCVMFTNKQTTEVYGITIDARYSYSSAFKFFAFANAAVCAFSMISLVYLFILGRQASDPVNFFLLFLHDLLMTMLLMAACGAATAIGYIGKYGNIHSGWMAICDHFGKFCHKVTAALVFSYLSLILLLLLTIFSANRSRKIEV